MAMEGGCRCGQVRFRIAGAPISVRTCWCRECQYFASGQATVNLVASSEGFEVEGEAADYPSIADSGNLVHRRFCAACGTHVYSHAEVRPHLVVVRVGALDERDGMKPQATIWTDSAPAWAVFDPETPSFPKGPPASLQNPTVPSKP